MSGAIDVLIVCGQGTYQEGKFYTEYPDRDVYVGHALSVKHIVAQWKYTYAVCSGSYTQKATPSVSEADSIEAIWADFQVAPKAVVVKDTLALDSVENVILGLMAVRLQSHAGAIRRVGVSAAWKFKKPRFNRLAEALGIVDRFYFHGYVDAGAADAGEKAIQGESAQLQQMAQSQDYLLLDTQWDDKRQKRYQGPDYDNRLSQLKGRFPKTFGALNALKLDRLNDGRRADLQAAFAAEVLM